MKPKSLAIFITIGFAFLWLFAWLAVASSAGAAVNSPLQVYELPLNPAGGAFEVNLGVQGHLWLSDYTAGEVWELDPLGRVYTTYAGLGYPGDARPDGAGSLWFADGSGERLGQLSLGTGALTRWPVTGSDGLYATQIDSAGKIWATSYLHPLLYRFDPTSQQLCSYAIPSTAASQYLETDGQRIWLADSNGGYIFRLDPDQDEYTLWELPASSRPVGLDLDLSGDLWWAEYDLGSLHRLNPLNDQLTTYALPITGSPIMLDASSSLVRFTDDSTGLIGSLDPATAASASADLTPSTQAVTPACTTVTPVTATPAAITSGRMDFTPATYSDLVDSAGWRIWQAPDTPAPYGVRLSGNSLWTADYGRQVLIWNFSGAVVSACKLVDEDGSLGTPGDQTPRPGWRVYLKVDGVRQEPGVLTSASGCYTWLDLDAGHTYAVEEQLPEGWVALTPTENNFGTAVEGQLYTFDFINHYDIVTIYLPFAAQP